MFTPISTALGALLMCTSVGFLFYTSGRILGASGILRSLVSAPSLTHNVPLLAGLGASVLLITLILPNFIPAYQTIEASGFGLGYAGVGLIGGALSGWGTKAGCGCPSGHMLCGLSRLSVRSLIAIGIFFPVAVVTAGLSGALNSVGCGAEPCYTAVYPSATETTVMGTCVAVAFAVNTILPHLLAEKVKVDAEPVEPAISGASDYDTPLLVDAAPERPIAKAIVAFLAGLEFGMGLLISGMADPLKLLRFFALPWDISKWDPSLLLVMVFGLGPSIVFTQMKGLSIKPVLDNKLQLPEGKVSDIGWKYCLGAAFFGVSWGLSGVCPGPAVLRTVVQPPWGVAWLAGFWLGGLLL